MNNNNVSSLAQAKSSAAAATTANAEKQPAAGSPGGKTGGDRKCYNCDKPGHIAAKCTEPKSEKKVPRGSNYREAARHAIDINVHVGTAAPVLAPVPAVASPAAAAPVVAPVELEEPAPMPTVRWWDVGRHVVPSVDAPHIAKECYGDLYIGPNRLDQIWSTWMKLRIAAFTLFFLVLFATLAAISAPWFMKEVVPIVKEYSSHDFRPMDLPEMNVTMSHPVVEFLSTMWTESYFGQGFDAVSGFVGRRIAVHQASVSELFSQDVTPVPPTPVVDYGLIAFACVVFCGSMPMFGLMLYLFRPRLDFKHYRLLGSVYTSTKWHGDRRHATFKTVPVDSDDFVADAKYLAYRLTECIGGVVTTRKIYVSYEMLIALRTPKLTCRFTTQGSMSTAFDDAMSFAKTQTQINLNRELEAGYDIVANTCRLFVVQLALLRFPNCDLNWVRL